MKIELKHWLAYIGCTVYGSSDLFTLKGAYEDENNEVVLMLEHPVFGLMEGDSVENDMLLRPITDITKSIEHNGQTFEPYEVISEMMGNYPTVNMIIRFTDELPYDVVQKLLEWHFDIFGLIKNKLATDINTFIEKSKTK